MAVNTSEGEALGLKLLQSVREMKAGKAARVTHVELTEAAEARQASGLSQSQFAEALGISKRTLEEWERKTGKSIPSIERTRSGKPGRASHVKR